MNAGSHALVASRLSLGRCAELLGERGVKVTRQAVAHWRAGKRLPGADARAALAQAPPGIAPTAWEEQPTVPKAKASQPSTSRRGKPSPESPPADPVDAGEVPRASEMAHSLLTRIQLLREQFETTSLGLPARKQLADMERAAITTYANLTGQNAPEKDLMGSPQWGKLADEILAALERFPEALRAVRAAMTGGAS